MAREDYRSASYEIWQAMAAGWDRERSWMWEASRAVSEEMLRALRPEPGQTILELAGGIAMVLQAMPETDREAVRKRVERATGDYRVDGGLELPGVALNASAG